MNWQGGRVSRMSDPRDRILARLRASRQGVSAKPEASALKLPEWSQDERIERFCQRMEAVRAEVHLADREHWPEKLRLLVKAKKLDNLLYAPDGPIGDIIQSEWNNNRTSTELITLEKNIETWKDELFFKVDAAVTSARAGIAGTGTLILWPTPEEPRTFSLVPPIHFAVLEVGRLYSTFAEVIEREGWNNGLPTNVLLISGPSKTADIEQTLAYGIHGPVELIVILVI